MKKIISALVLLSLALCMEAANTKTKVTQVTSAVTLTDDVDYIVTGTPPFANEGLVDIVNTEHAVLIFESVKPSSALSLLTNRIRINGAVAQNGVNCQVKMYAQQGSMVMPYDKDFKPLTVYSEPNFQGESCSDFGLEHTGGFMNTLTDAKLNNKIRSFRLKRGYMVTFATQASGYGYQRCFIAQDADVEFAKMPPVLDGTISSYRVFKWNTAGKAGIANATGADICSALKVVSCYSFGVGEDRGIDAECVPHHIYENWPSAAECGSKTYSPHMKTNNEPRNPSDDHQQTLDDILYHWQSLMRTGMRLCSPSSWDGSDYTNGTGFLKTFFDSIDARGWRCDIVDLHCYWTEGNFNNIVNWVNSVHRPVWISEWVWGASWNSNGAFANGVTEAQNANAVKNICSKLNGYDYVERYYYWNSERDPSKLYKNGSLTAAGQYYSTMKTGVGYNGRYDHIPTVPTMKAPTEATWTHSETQTVVKWKDYNGEYNKVMDLERKVRGGQWEIIANIEKKETASNYTYTDENAPEGAFYRVHIVDMNGKEYYSNNDMVAGDAVECSDGQTRYAGGNIIANGDFSMGSYGWTNGRQEAIGQPWFEVVPLGNTGKHALQAYGSKGQTDPASLRTYFTIEKGANYCFRLNSSNAGTFIKVDLADGDKANEKNILTMRNPTAWEKQAATFYNDTMQYATLSFRWLNAKGLLGDIELFKLYDSREEALADGLQRLRDKAETFKAYNTQVESLNEELTARMAAFTEADDQVLAQAEAAINEALQAYALQPRLDSLVEVAKKVVEMPFNGQQALNDAIATANAAANAAEKAEAFDLLKQAIDDFLPMTKSKTQPQSPSFAATTGWETKVGTYTGGDQRTATQGGKTCWNAWWSGFGASYGNRRTMEIRQTITGLPSGLYQLECKAATQHFCLSDQHGYIVSQQDTACTPKLQFDYMDLPTPATMWQTLTTPTVFVPEGGSVTIGFAGSKEGATDYAWREYGNTSSSGDRREGWWCATDFALLYHPMFQFKVKANQYSTVCLPYNCPVPEGIKLYSIAGLMADYQYLALEEVTEPVAGMPYIYICEDTLATFYTSGNAVNNPIITGTNNLRGYFTTSLKATAGRYMMFDGVFERLTARTDIEDYSANLTKAEGIPVLTEWNGAKVKINGVVDELGEPVGIDGTKADAEEGNKQTYDLGGRPTEKGGHGIYIERKNGRSQKLLKARNK